MTGKEMNDEFDLLYDTASEEAPGLDEFEKSMFLTKGMYELTEKSFDEYLHNASRGFHDDEINRNALKGFIASAVVELEKTPTKSSSKAAAESMSSADRKVDPHSYEKYKIEPTTQNSYFFQRPSDSMGVIHEDVILRPIADTVKVNKQLVANVTPIRYDHIDRLMKNPFMKPRHNLAFRLDHSDYDGTSLSEIICDSKYAAFQYRVKYVKRPYPIILTRLDEGWGDEPISIESQILPYLEPKFEDNIRRLANGLRLANYELVYDRLFVSYMQSCEYSCLIKYEECIVDCNSNTACEDGCIDTQIECNTECETSSADKAKKEADILYPPLYDLTLDEIKLYIIDNAPEDSDIIAQMDYYLRISQATNIDITMHHDIVQRGVELAILHYRENTLQNNMQAKIKEN